MWTIHHFFKSKNKKSEAKGRDWSQPEPNSPMTDRGCPPCLSLFQFLLYQSPTPHQHQVHETGTPISTCSPVRLKDTLDQSVEVNHSHGPKARRKGPSDPCQLTCEELRSHFISLSLPLVPGSHSGSETHSS